MSIKDNLQLVEKRIAEARQRSRFSQHVTLICVSKNQDVKKVKEGVHSGIQDLGENYVQELIEKQAAVLQPVRWHLIGPLQSNKIKFIVGKVDLIHSVDRESLAHAISVKAQSLELKQKILIQVNIANEATKSGVSAQQVSALIQKIKNFNGIELCGFMTMPPFVEKPEASREPFRQLRELRDVLQKEHGLALPILSMGTSQDFEIAIEEGATHVRVGTQIFGARE